MKKRNLLILLWKMTAVSLFFKKEKVSELEDFQ